MRSMGIGLCALILPAAPAFAGQSDPAPGASVTVTSTPGGRVSTFNSPTEAQAACTAAGGGFGLRDRRFVCVNARGPLRSTRAPDPAPAPAAPPPATPGPAGGGAAAGVAVESVGLRPGERASFTLAEGYSHRLLRRASPTEPGAITIGYEVSNGASRVTAVSRTGYPLTFSVLADPDGNGGFSPMGEIALPGDGSPAARSWPGALGAINVGNFVGGPR